MSVIVLKSGLFSVKPKVWVEGDAIIARTSLLLMLLCLFFYRKWVVIDRKREYVEISKTLFWFFRSVEMIPFRRVDHIKYDYESYATSGGAIGRTAWRNDQLEVFTVALVLSRPKGRRVPLFEFRGEGAVETGLAGVLCRGDAYVDFAGDQEDASLRLVDLMSRFMGVRVGEKLPRWDRSGEDVRRCPSCGRPATKGRETCFVCGTPILTAIAIALLEAILMGACGDKVPAKDPEATEVAPKSPERAEISAPRIKIFPSAGAAVADLLSKNEARIVAFGEFHQTEGTTHIESSVMRFTDQILPQLKTSRDLVVETWVKEGNCGHEEEAVLEDLDETTERPRTTETEVARMMRLSREAGIAPHILTIGCEDYARLHGDGGQVDYWKFLGLITEGLRDKAKELAASEHEVDGRRRVVIYGGAIHNDEKPYDDLAPYSFAEDLRRHTGGSYLEVDLYVPEFVRDNDQLAAEPWFPLFQEHVSRDKVLLIEQSPSSYIVVFKEGVRSKPK